MRNPTRFTRKPLAALGLAAAVATIAAVATSAPAMAKEGSIVGAAWVPTRSRTATSSC